jgi:hypothetical protein
MVSVRASRAVIAGAAALVLAVPAGCSGGTSARPGRNAPAADSTATAVRAARAAAQEAFDRYSSGDYAGAWETYTDEGRAEISQANFVAFNTRCPPKILHHKASVVGVRLENPTTAVARVQIGQTLTAYTLRYERDHWRVQPSADAAAMWKLGVDQAVEKAKAAGLC